jgi:hypothetical protein
VADICLIPGVKDLQIVARLALRPKAIGCATTSDRASSQSTYETTGNGGWTIRLDTRPATASVSIETGTSRDYVNGLFDGFARVGMLLRLLAEGKSAYPVQVRLRRPGSVLTADTTSYSQPSDRGEQRSG